MNIKEQIEFNKENIKLYIWQIENSEISQKKSIWSKIFSLLKENIEFYKKIDNYKRKKQKKKIIRNLKENWFELKKENHNTLDFYNNDLEKNDFDYDYWLQTQKSNRDVWLIYY